GEGRRPGRARGAPGARARAPHGGHRGAGGPADRDAGDGRPDRARAGAAVLMASGLCIAVVGATGAAGQTTLRILEERKFPVPELNAHAARRHHGILACPNCTTIVTVMPLKPLHDAGRLTRVIATSFQAVSGAGVNGIAELREQTLAWARGEAMVARHFPHQIAFNLVPAIDRFGPDGYTAEEMKLVNETRKILETPGLPVAPTTVRVPVF